MSRNGLVDLFPDFPLPLEGVFDGIFKREATVGEEASRSSDSSTLFDFGPFNDVVSLNSSSEDSVFECRKDS